MPNLHEPLTIIQRFDNDEHTALLKRFWTYRCVGCGTAMPQGTPNSQKFCTTECRDDADARYRSHLYRYEGKVA